ncbi:unnamed protein product [Mytilus coruscus]|uniref:Uncharacterized protein n=1 Tax=Mytilus coruscus TaxID=42192 RepID=A0A6J8A4M4_MYTCO|nr:unnamed protein product [Mytilus coruscus]
MFYPVKIICYFAIASSVGFQFSACISLTQEVYNIITNKPLRLVCDVEIPITTQVTIRSPDNVAVVTCTGAVLSPPSPAGCTSSGVYTGSINETAYTVTVTTNNLPANVNGTWKCTHNSTDATINFPNPVPCFTTENFSPSSFTGNQTSDTAAISLSATYSCINVDVTFKWILTASMSHEVPSTSVSKDSSTCTDTGTCTGVNAYTGIISSGSIFQFATNKGLQGLYELKVEAHYTNEITALQSQSIGNFVFSVYASTPIPTTNPLPDKECLFELQMSYLECVFALGTPALVGLCIIIYSIYKSIQYCRNMSETKTVVEQNHVVGLSELQTPEEKVFQEDSKTSKWFQDVKKGKEQTQRLSTQEAGQSKSDATNETTK